MNKNILAFISLKPDNKINNAFLVNKLIDWCSNKELKH